MIFKIVQKIDTNHYIHGECSEIGEIHIGYVDSEDKAEEFCEKHKDCDYHVIKTNSIDELEDNLINGMSDVELIRVPFKKWM